MEIIINIYIAIFGLVIGSYLNVLIYRIPRGISTVKSRSLCTSCGHELTSVDLFPLFSYLFLRGKCRYCKAKISPQYPIVEAANALCYILVYIKFGPSITALLYAVVCSCLIVIAATDFIHKIIPDRFNLIILACAFVIGFTTKDITWVERLIGAFSLSALVGIIIFFTGGMGMGDLKLFAACGFLLGWKQILLTMLIASVTAALFALVLLINKKAERKTELAFGPFIALGVLICIFAGAKLINFYLSLY